MNKILVLLIVAALAAGCTQSSSPGAGPIGLDVASYKWLVRPTADDRVDGRPQSSPQTAAAPAALSTGPERSVPVSEGAAPVSEGAAPVSEGAAPVSEGAAPVSDGSAPVSDGPAPVSDPRPLDGQFSAYKPTYVLWGATSPNVKFQFSAKFRAFAPDGAAAQQFPPISNIYFGYTQMSLWDTEDLSNATIDTTYMPELFYATHTAPRADHHGGAQTLGLQAGARHESNGETDPDSRNINYVYVQPTLYFGEPDGISGQISPLARVYFSESDDNPDIENYLGYFGLDGALRFGRGWQVAASSRIGAHPGKGAIQVDVSYPLKRFIGGQVDTFFHVQYFNGFGESIRTYNEHDQKLRVGLSFVR